MRLVQYLQPGRGRRVGRVEGDALYDLTDLNPGWTRLYLLFQDAQQAGRTIVEHVQAALAEGSASAQDYQALWQRRPGDPAGWLLPPLDHPDPAHCFVGGTGLTHLGSTSARHAMHTDANTPKTDSQKMFEMGVAGGKPPLGRRGIAPECFYKGTGAVLRGHQDYLDIPAFTEDGGEEPEIVGCYVIGENGAPYRLGFAIGNEWSDHTVERVNYLWLAPSKLRTCSVGPELITDEAFVDLRGSCTIAREGQVYYDSGELLTGEENMSHTLANLEDHHFKHPQFRLPGDVHLYFFGTMKLSFGSRGPFIDGDQITIRFGGMGAPLVNYVRRIPRDDTPILVRKG